MTAARKKRSNSSNSKTAKKIFKIFFSLPAETAESFTGSDSEMAAVVVAVPPDFTVSQRNIIRSVIRGAQREREGGES